MELPKFDKSNEETGENSKTVASAGAKAKGDFSAVVGGIGGTASGMQSVVIGGGFIDEEHLWPNIASGNNAVAIGGAGNLASGPFSACIGADSNKAVENCSMVLGGGECVASGNQAVLIGSTHCQASGTGAITIGCHETETNENRAIAIGCDHTTVSSEYSVAIGGKRNANFSKTGASFVSIGGCGSKQTPQSALVVESAGTTGKVYIKDVGGWKGESCTLDENEDVATIINSLIKRIEELEKQVSKLKTEERKDTSEASIKPPSERTLSREEELELAKELLTPKMDEF